LRSIVRFTTRCEAGPAPTAGPFQPVADDPELVASATARLESPGLRPRLPIASTLFIDVSAPAVAQLNAAATRSDG
jgi:hypothetical protein